MEYNLGIVLSGGGIKGVGHLAYLERLEALGYKPDIIAGTSAGALIGAFYAAGVPTQDILKFFKSTSFFKMKWISRVKPGLFDSDSYISLIKEYLPETFEALDIPLYSTSVNLSDCSIRYFHSGPLHVPIIASCSVPFLLSPVQLENGLYGDGGIMDNYPIFPIKDKVQRLIGCYTSRPEPKQPEQLNTTLKVMNHSYELLLYGANAQKFGETNNTTVLPLERFGAFNTSEVDDIYKVSKEYLSKIDPTEPKYDAYLSMVL